MATIIEARTNNKVKVDGQERDLDGITAIKAKKMYFGVKDNELYAGEIYGKICLLYKVEMGTAYMPGQRSGFGDAPGMPGYQRVARKVEYLQKLGSADIDKFNAGVLVDYVSDNQAALAKANGGKAWGLVSYVPAAGFAGGVIWTFVDLLKVSKTDGATPNLGTPLLLAGASLPVYFITAGISNHKLHKAIKIYNSTPNDAAQ